MMDINCIITNKKKEDNCQRKHEQIAYEYEKMENINNIHVWKNNNNRIINDLEQNLSSDTTYIRVIVGRQLHPSTWLIGKRLKDSTKQ